MDSKIHFSLTQLEYVLAVYRHGHFAKAAQACFVTQPTLSMQIQKLEETSGVIIFDRSKKPVLLTDKGQKLIEQMQKVVSEAKRLADLMSVDPSGKLEGQLHVAIIPTIAPYLLPLLLPLMQRKFPGLQLKIQEMQTQRIVEALENDEVDVGVLATPLKISKIQEKPVYWEPFFVLCQKGHELSSQKRIKHKDLSGGDLWLLEEGHCLRHQILDVCSVRNRKTQGGIQFESGSIETLKNLVSTSGGYTLVPQLATSHLASNVVLIPFERPIPAREIGLVQRREHYKQELVVALEQGIRESLPEEIRSIKPKDLEVLPVE